MPILDFAWRAAARLPWPRPEIRTVKFEAFERAARASYDEIPRPYKQGIDGLVVSREAIPHPDHADVYTLGECITEEHMSDYGGPDTTRSVIALYWGSFQRLAKRNPDFDWDEELWETLTHELRHHLESLAGDDALDSVDYAAEQTFKRDEGHDFDPWYFQHGEPVSEGVYRVESSYYIEREVTETDFAAATSIEFEWDEQGWTFPKPEELGDVHFVWIDGVVDGSASLEVVLVRKRSWWEDAKRMLSTYRPLVLESKAAAEPAGA